MTQLQSDENHVREIEWPTENYKTRCDFVPGRIKLAAPLSIRSTDEALHPSREIREIEVYQWSMLTIICMF
jgi:hypothetical protein